MLCALAPMMLPTRPRTDEQMKNHLRPNMSDRRPTRVKPIANPAVQEMLTQMMSGDGPIAAFMRARVLAGRTHPRYLSAWLKPHLMLRVAQKHTPIFALDM